MSIDPMVALAFFGALFMGGVCYTIWWVLDYAYNEDPELFEKKFRH